MLYGKVPMLMHELSKTDEIYRQLQLVMNCNDRSDYDMYMKSLQYDGTFKRSLYSKEFPLEQWRVRYFMWVIKSKYQQKYGDNRL